MKQGNASMPRPVRSRLLPWTVRPPLTVGCFRMTTLLRFCPHSSTRSVKASCDVHEKYSAGITVDRFFRKGYDFLAPARLFAVSLWRSFEHSGTETPRIAATSSPQWPTIFFFWRGEFSNVESIIFNHSFPQMGTSDRICEQLILRSR